jgi:hypothetical protein
MPASVMESRHTVVQPASRLERIDVAQASEDGSSWDKRFFRQQHGRPRRNTT